jgi:acetyl esterase/lipase
MKRFIAVFVSFSVFSSGQLFSMFSSFRNAARIARGFPVQSNVVASSWSGMPYSGALSSSEGFLSERFSPVSRRRYVTYSDEGSGSHAQEGFVDDERWTEMQTSYQPSYSIRERFADFVPSVMRGPFLNVSTPTCTWCSSSVEPLSQDVAPNRLEESLDLGGPIVSWNRYEPESYASLNPLQKKLISEADYEKFVAEYKNMKDVEMYRFTYIVDGEPVVGFSLLPKQTPPSGKYPLVIALRGGFNGEGPFHEWAKTDLPYIMRHFAFYAQNGYAVLTSQYRGADGNKNKDQFGGDDVHDVLGLFDVAREMKNIDMNDISLSVFSRGTVMGFKTLQAIKGRIPIRSVVIKGGISDLVTFIKEDPKYIVPILEQARPDFKERSDEIAQELSLVIGADVLKDIPTLILHNKHDNVVPSKLSENLIQRLQEQGTEHEAHFFPGKHHQILESNGDVQELTIKWLDKFSDAKKIKSSL